MRFSIGIPVYNRRAHLADAIASCLNQTAHDCEIVVSDDCSSEDLSSVVESFDDPRIRYSRSTSRIGAAANHQRAVSLCTGTYVIVLNSDDLLLPNCLETAGKTLDGCLKAAAVYFSVTYLDGATVDGFHASPALSFADRSTLLEHAWLEKFVGTTPSCCMFRRSVFNQLGGYRPALRLAYDWELYMRFMTRGGGVLFLPEILCVYRKHHEQMVQTSAINGLKDMLLLWREREYAHWSSSQIGDLCIPYLRAGLRSPRATIALLADLRRSGAPPRLIGGVIQAIGRRAWGRWARRPAREPDSDHYRAPLNVEQAQRLARTLVSAVPPQPKS